MRVGFGRRLSRGHRHQPQWSPKYRNAVALSGIAVAVLIPILVVSLPTSSGRDNVTLPRIPRPTPVTAPSSPGGSDAAPIPLDGQSAISVPVQPPPPVNPQTTSPTRSPARPSARPPAGPNLAAGRPTTESSHTDVYVATSAVDGNPGTYWESANRAFPQSLTVDLGAATSVSRVVLKLPPLSTWPTRTQTLSVLGSADGSRYSTIVNTADYTFNPPTGNAATIAFTSTTQRYLRLTITANTEWPAAQVSEFEVYAS